MIQHDTLSLPEEIKLVTNISWFKVRLEFERTVRNPRAKTDLKQKKFLNFFFLHDRFGPEYAIIITLCAILYQHYLDKIRLLDNKTKERR